MKQNCKRISLKKSQNCCCNKSIKMRHGIVQFKWKESPISSTWIYLLFWELYRRAIYTFVTFFLSTEIQRKIVNNHFIFFKVFILWSIYFDWSVILFFILMVASYQSTENICGCGSHTKYFMICRMFLK